MERIKLNLQVKDQIRDARTHRRNRKAEIYVHYRAIGYTNEEASKCAGVHVETGKRYRTQYRDRIHELTIQQFKDGLPDAIKTILELNGKAIKEDVRLKAANRVCEGAGVGVIHKSEIVRKTDSELVQQLLDACQGDVGKARTVLAALGIEATVALPENPTLQ